MYIIMPSNSDLNTFEDRYHLTNEGNILLGKEFKKLHS